MFSKSTQGKRPRSHATYFALAAINITTVASGILINWRESSSMQMACREHRAWAEREVEIAELAHLGMLLDGPGNDVFNSRDPVTEEKRFDEILIQFSRQYESVVEKTRTEVASNPNGHGDDTWRAGARSIQELLPGIESGLARMTDAARSVFRCFREGNPELAAESMAAMDRRSGDLNDIIQNILQQSRNVQISSLASQLEATTRAQRFEYCLSALIVLLVIGTVYYGSKLQKEMQDSMRERERNLAALEAQNTAVLAAQTAAETARISLEMQNKELDAARTAALDAARLKSEFLANMSHEIRTPLNGIIGFVDLLNETSLDVRQQDYVKTIQSSSEALLGILNDILDFSKVEAGKLEIESIEFSLPEIVEGVAGLFAPRAQDKGIELITHIRSHIADRVLGDPSRVRQILLNLVGNAIKFTEQGHVAVEMDARAEGEMAHVSIRVRDTGIGIPEDRIGSLFQAFIQIDGSTARKYGGTGLGLAISHKLAALMGGKLTCTSKVGDGTEFLLEVSLPIRERRAERRPWLPDTARGLRVLVVDDNDASLRLVHEMLASEQCVVWTATSAAKAVQMLRDAESPSSLPQLIICDYLMPGHDGFDFAAEVHKLKSCDNIPLVLITALKFQRWQDAAEHGFASVITKPVRRHEFWDTIREVMGYEARTWAGARRTAFVEQPVAQTPSTCDGGKLRVLLAEDNAVNQKLAVAILSKMNCDITTARDGVEAVRLHAELNPDLIFMDIQMPELDGMQASRRIRESEPPNRRVPIIAMTARAMKGDRDDCVAAGMDDYVSKPLRREEIDRVFAHWGNVAIANRQPV